jgi:chromosome segregation ATPase
MDEGFIDLRYGGERDSAGESFWPSFTDIMMVVLMIFMIASTILMLRNWELVHELRATLEAEREAEALAQTATRTSATLEERLAQAQSEISELRIQLLRSSEQNQSAGRQLTQVRQQVLELETGKQELLAHLQQSERERGRLEDRLQQFQTDFERLTSSYTVVQKQLSEAETAMRAREQSSNRELTELRQQYADSEQQLAVLRGNYDELSVKYDKLIKPARTASGKRLVSVRYRKEDGRYRLEFKESEQGEYKSLSRRQLDERLTRLKDKYPRLLYVKVIIPENSGLSYNEAWTFTQDILTSYDYYYQDD